MTKSCITSREARSEIADTSRARALAVSSSDLWTVSPPNNYYTPHNNNNNITHIHGEFG